MIASVRVNMIVEGQTEETFVQDLLEDYFAHYGIYISKRCIETGRVSSRSVELGQKGPRTFKGGMSSYKKAKKDIKRWLRENKSAFLTTMFDLYALPNDFPNYKQSQSITDPYKRVGQLENGLARDIGNLHFIPYIQLHEFEGLLFSNVEAIDTVLSLYGNGSKLSQLRDIRSKFKTPEEIDQGATTAPSKRLLSLYTGYDKIAFGPLIAKEIGLDTIRNECPHFNKWMTSLCTVAHNGGMTHQK
jgi:hypothetical protein